MNKTLIEKIVEKDKEMTEKEKEFHLWMLNLVEKDLEYYGEITGIIMKLADLVEKRHKLLKEGFKIVSKKGL